MNINSIKATTPTTSFINVAKVEEKVNSCLNDFENIINRLEDKIDKEVREGGLSIYAYRDKNGESPLMYGNGKISAKTIYDDIDVVRAEIQSLKKSVPLAAKKHKLEEYEVLKAKTTAHIRTLEEILETKRKELEAANASKDPTAISKATAEYDEAKTNLDTWNKKIDDYNAKIKRYS